jgi:hydrogenase maturation protein HypF
LEGQVLGVSWDGTGYGLDGTVWGGEFLRATRESFQRVGHFRTFCLPGGEKAIKEPRRTALGALYEIFGDEVFDMSDVPTVQAFSPSEGNVVRQMLVQRVNSPVTSSVGRLFDAVASLVGLRQRVGFEGQAAMELEFAIGDAQTDEVYPFRLAAMDEKSPRRKPLENLKLSSMKTFHPWQQVVDWEPMLRALLDDVRQGVSRERIAAKFHNALAEIIVAVAQRVGEERVVLTGGCFQNKYLTERAVQRLAAEGFRPYWHQRVPPNDGGIALGQAVAAYRG